MIFASHRLIRGVTVHRTRTVGDAGPYKRLFVLARDVRYLRYGAVPGRMTLVKKTGGAFVNATRE